MKEIPVKQLALIGSIASVIIFAYSNFQTKAEAEKDLKPIEISISEINQNIREINRKIDLLKK